MSVDAAVHAIERQEWLAPIEKSLKTGLEAAFRKDTENGKPVENALHGVWLGHPLHPAITGIPLGAWTVAFLFDLIESAGGSRDLRPGADAALNVGIAGALASAVTGLTDWKDISKDERRAGLVHSLLNTAALGLYVASSIQRARSKRGAGLAASYLGYGISMCAAWLGGHLVYAGQIGVGRTAAQRPPADFVRVASLNDLKESEPYKAEHEGYPIVLVRQGGAVHALADRCTHLGGPLSEGKVEGNCIRCPWHGSTFALDDGAVKESPATRPVAAFETQVVENEVSVRMRKGR